jgi:pimeloyl-ACP methyl ester carboxylesterase
MTSFALTAFALGRFPARRLGMGSDDEARPYVTQLAGFAGRNFWGSRCGYQDYLASMANVTQPILSVVGSADRWMCRPEWAARWLSHASNAPVDFRVVGEREGDPQGIDHMKLVTDPRMKPVWQEIARWILDKVG